ERLERVAAAARRRIASQKARRMRANVAAAFKKNKPAEAEPDPDRRRKRVEAVTGCDAETAGRLIAGGSPAELRSGDELMGAERLIGPTVDYLPVSFLTIGVAAASSVARVIERGGQPIGSGFLISRRLFITNNHVIASADEAGRMLLEFDYETDLRGNPCSVTRFAMDPSLFFTTNGVDNL